MHTMRLGALALVLGTGACTDQTTYIKNADGGPVPAEHAEAGTAPDETGCSYPLAQGPTAPCCESLGIDACGAKLACAALEGRTVAVCYPERSVEDTQPCTLDRLCSSDSCVSGVCAYGAVCPGPSAICGPDENGKPRVCTRTTTESFSYFCTTVGAKSSECVGCRTVADCGPGFEKCEKNACLRYGGGSGLSCNG